MTQQQDEIELTPDEIDWMVWCVQTVLRQSVGTLSEKDVEALFDKLYRFQFSEDVCILKKVKQGESAAGEED